MPFFKILCGFVFLFDFYIQGFDVLPDIIGYILIYQGMTGLEDENDHFEKAKKSALPMIFIALLTMAMEMVMLDFESLYQSHSFYRVIAAIPVVINIHMVYHFCKGIEQESQKTSHEKLEALSGNTWYLYLIASFFTFVQLIFLDEVSLFTLATILFSYLSYAFLLVLSYKSKVWWENIQDGNQDIVQDKNQDNIKGNRHDG